MILYYISLIISVLVLMKEIDKDIPLPVGPIMISVQYNPILDTSSKGIHKEIVNDILTYRNTE